MKLWICPECQDGWGDVNGAALHSEETHHWVYEIEDKAASGGDGHGWAVPTGRSTHGSDVGGAYRDEGKDPNSVRAVFLNDIMRTIQQRG